MKNFITKFLFIVFVKVICALAELFGDTTGHDAKSKQSI